MPDTTATAPPPPSKTLRRTLFTTANAREMSRRGNLAIKTRLQALRESAAVAAVSPADCFNLQRLARVRVQLQRLDSELETCSLKDPKRIKGLAEAAAVLAEEERKLAGRPEPGRKGARRTMVTGEAMLDLGQVSAAPPPATSTPGPSPSSTQAAGDQAIDLPPG